LQIDDVNKLVSALQPIAWPIFGIVVVLVLGTVVVVLLLRNKNIQTPWASITQPIIDEQKELEKPDALTLTLPEPTVTLAAIEENIRGALANNPEPVRALIRELAVTRMRLYADGIYSAIFGSQLRLLRLLLDKGGSITAASAQRFYRDVKKEFAPTFDAVSLEAYLQFLVTNGLVSYDGDRLKANEIARDLLMIVDKEKPPNSRFY
jgi:hypothetical protein